MYDLYKPFRNYMRQFPLEQSLLYVWAFSENIAHNHPLPRLLNFTAGFGRPYSLADKVYPWELELLTGELVMNAAAIGTRSLGNWKDFSAAINHIRRLDNEVYARYGRPETVLRELHRIAHRQFPWQVGPNMSGMMRYRKIFGGAMDEIVSRRTGLTVDQLYKLGLASAGHFLSKPRLVTSQDYAVLDINADTAARFFSLLTCDIDTLRAATHAEQNYDDRWEYSLNPLRARPLVALDKRYPERVICPIPSFLLRRVSEGIFYDVAGADGFENAYGPAFQSYVGDVLKAILRPPRFSVDAEQEYWVGNNRKDGVDWIVSDETSNVFIECKAKRLRRDAKFNLNGNDLAADLDVMARFIVQHYKNIADAMAGRTAWEPNGRPIYPVIVTLESWWIFTPEIVRDLTSKIDEHLAGAKLDRDIVDAMPYTVASIDELEIGAQIIAQTGIAPFLGVKTNDTHREWAVGPFATSAFPEEMKKVNRRLFSEEWISLGEPFAEGAL